MQGFIDINEQDDMGHTPLDLTTKGTKLYHLLKSAGAKHRLETSPLDQIYSFAGVASPYSSLALARQDSSIRTSYIRQSSKDNHLTFSASCWERVLIGLMNLIRQGRVPWTTAHPGVKTITT